MINWEFSVPGIPDELFLRGKVPMTKEEVRALTLSKLRLTSYSYILDVGAGTGSISVECGLLASRGKVYAIEKNPVAIDLIYENCKRFGVSNIEIIAGEAPAAIKKIPLMDRVVIGGSGGNLKDIIVATNDILKPEGRIVLNGILLETVTVGLQALKEQGYRQVDLITVSIARGRELGGRTALKALNPVFIISAAKGKERK